MLCLLFLSAILAVLAQGKNNCPLYKYYTVNTFRAQKSFSVSCYGVGAGCKVYYAPPGSGCNESSLEFIWTVPENETYFITHKVDIKLGGGFCSDNQIGVYYADQARDYIVAHLPRATDAGTLFHLALVNSQSTGTLECVVSALSSAATVSIEENGNVKSLSIDPFMIESFDFSYPESKTNPGILKINSDSPVIVSCVDNSVDARLVTLQQISSEPVLINTDDNSQLIILLSDCSTNELITDTSFATVNLAVEDGTLCVPLNLDLNTDIKGFKFNEACVSLVEPLNNVCVSVGLQVFNSYLIDMAVPESKLSTRFIVQDADIDSVNLLSFSETNCTGFADDESEENTVDLVWGADELDGKVSIATWLETFSQVSRLECQNPVLLVSREDVLRVQFSSSYQSEKFWQPFFKSLDCNVPSSFDDARSLVTSWVAFFAVFIFSSSLI